MKDARKIKTVTYLPPMLHEALIEAAADDPVCDGSVSMYIRRLLTKDLLVAESSSLRERKKRDGQ